MAWNVVRYMDGKLVSYVATNWNHVGCLIATERIVSWTKIED